HQGADVAAADEKTKLAQQIAQHPAARKRILQMQFVELAHQPQLGLRQRMPAIVNTAAADPESLGLLDDSQLVLRVDHRFAFSRPALLSALSKKSFSRVSSPILACRALRSTAAAAGSVLASPKTPEAPSRSCVFHCVIGWGECRTARL